MNDELEYILSQYLDGTLPPEEKAALEQLVASDAQAAAILQQHLALDRLIKSAGAMPDVRWEQLAARISDAVSRQHIRESADTQASVPDELELAIMQYVDGELPADDRAALEQRIESEPGLRQILAQHRSLEAVVKHAWPLPHVDFERLADHLSETVVEEVAPSSYKMSAWIKYGSAIAIAACVLIITALAIIFGTRNGHGGKGTIADKDVPASKPLVQIAIGPEAPKGRAQISISVSPGDDDGGYYPVVASLRPRIEVDETVPVYTDGGIFNP